MTYKKHPPFEHNGFFLLRTPLLSFIEFQNWTKCQIEKSNIDLTEALKTDWSNLKTRLKDLVKHPTIRESIFLASPDLENQLDGWIHSPKDAQTRKIDLAMTRYFARMASRPTPFGLYACCSNGKISDRTEIVLTDNMNIQKKTRLDTGYLSSIVEAFKRAPSTASRFPVAANPSLYGLANRFHYIETSVETSGRRFHLVALDADTYLSHILEVSKSEKTVPHLIENLCTWDRDISKEEAESYVLELVKNQVLLPAVDIPLTNVDPIPYLVQKLAQNPDQIDICHSLNSARKRMRDWDKKGPGLSSNHYRAMADQLKKQPVNVDISKLFQVDGWRKTTRCTLSEHIFADLIKGIDLFSRLNDSINIPSRLDRFREAFVKRYGSGPVPLLEALDPESGLGDSYTKTSQKETLPLLKGLHFANQAMAGQVSWRNREQHLLARIMEFDRSKKKEWELTEQDLKQLENHTPISLPNALAATIRISSSSFDAIDRGEFDLFIHSFSGPSGVRMLSRFCHLDPEYESMVRRHLQREESLEPDAIFAEIIHLPEGRTGNVLIRPALRAHEIPVFSGSSVPSEFQIQFSDLNLTLNNDHFILMSKSRRKKIIPRLSTAHNYMHPKNLPHYQFLCDLQTQHLTTPLRWDWSPFQFSPFLPRIKHGRIILSLAQWTLTESERDTLKDKKDSHLFNYVQRLRKDRFIPRWVCIMDGDNQLTLDLENILCIEILAQQARKKRPIQLIELFPDPQNLCILDQANAPYYHELMVPLTRHLKKTHTAPISPSTQSEKKITMHFPPGSDFLYFKMYVGPASADRVLKTIFDEIKEQFIPKKWITSWFFIRYGDPEWHIRLRLKGKKDDLLRNVLPILSEEFDNLTQQGLLKEFQIDSYHRESDRYGGTHGIELAEQLFAIDSDAVCQLLNLLKGKDSDCLRWEFALLGVDFWLKDLCMDPIERLSLLKKMSSKFHNEFQTRKTGLYHDISRKYRSMRRNLEVLLLQKEQQGRKIDEANKIFQSRTMLAQPIISQYLDLEMNHLLTCPFLNIIPSFIHMFTNRIFMHEGRKQELVIYEFLKRTYVSQSRTMK